MDTKKVRELAGILKEFDLTRIDVRDDEDKTLISLEKYNYYNGPIGSVHYDQKNQAQSETEARISIVDTEAPIDLPNVDESITTIKSPIVGVFFSSPSPDNPPFVSIGSHVKKGDVVCIIEAMKLMNEVVADQEGEIMDVCIKNGDIAEYGQVLFKVKS